MGVPPSQVGEGVPPFQVGEGEGVPIRGRRYVSCVHAGGLSCLFTFFQIGNDGIWTDSHAESHGGATGLAEAEVPVHVCVRSLRGGLAGHDESRYDQTLVEVPVVWETPS